MERITSVIEAKIDDMTYAQHLLSALFSVVYDAPVDMRVLAAERIGNGNTIGYDPCCWTRL
jgi:hypothetical protein